MNPNDFPRTRLLNFTPVAVEVLPTAVAVDRSKHAFGFLGDALDYAARGYFTHVEATDVQTGERFYLAAA